MYTLFMSSSVFLICLTLSVQIKDIFVLFFFQFRTKHKGITKKREFCFQGFGQINGLNTSERQEN